MNEQADRIVRAFVFRTKDGGDDEWYWTTQEPIPDGEGGVMVSRLTGPFENEDEAWEDAENNLFPGVKLRDGGGDGNNEWKARAWRDDGHGAPPVTIGDALSRPAGMSSPRR